VRFKVDENLPVEVAEVLRAAGHDATTVEEEAVGGAQDPVIAQLIRKEARALVTLDTGFMDIRSYPPSEYEGLIVLRPGRQDRGQILQACARVVKLLSGEKLAGRLWIVEADRVRIRDSGQ
jgi:predicted nuclease of predicted toxin-antitoxin system